MIKQSWSYWISALAMIFLGMIFVVAGAGKLMATTNSLSGFTLSVYSNLPFANVAYGLFPYLEIVLGTLLILGIFVKFTAVISLVPITAFLVFNSIAISNGMGTVLCSGCFGVAGKFSTYAALTVDILMVALVAIILFCYRGGFFNRTPWYLETGRRAEGELSLSTPEA